MNEPTRILIVEDMPTDADLAESEIRQALPAPLFRRVETREAYLNALETFQPDLILSNYRLPRFDGMTALKLALERAPLTPVIIYTNSRNEDTAVACMKAGATDYVLKDRLKRLNPAVLRALRERQERIEHKRAEQELHEKEKHSQSLLRLSRKLEQAQTYAEALNVALDEVKTVIGYQILWIYLFTPDKEYAKALMIGGPASTAALNLEHVTTLSIRGDPMLEQIAAAKSIVIVADARTDERTNKQIVAQLDSRTIVNVPIFLFDQHLGTVGAGTFGDEGVRVPTAAEQEYLSALASHMAVTLDRIKLLAERAQVVQALRQSEQNLNRAQAVSHTGSWTFDVPNDILEWSAETYRLFGISPDTTPTPEAMYHCVHPDDRADMRAAWNAALSGTPYDIEHRVIVEGKVKWLRERAELQFAADGSPLKAIGTAQDITERKAAEAALQRRAEELTALQAIVLEITTEHKLNPLLRTIVESAARLLRADGGSIYLCEAERRQVRCVISYNIPNDYTGTVLRYGEGAAGAVALTGEPLIIDDYRTWPGRAALFDREQSLRAVISVPMFWHGQVTGVIHALRYREHERFTEADLDLLTLFANRAAIAVENARLIQGLELELIERKLAEQALRVSETRYRLLFETAPVGILLATPKGHVLEVNLTALEILGSPSAKSTQDINLLTFPPLVQVGFAANLRRCVETAKPLSAEIMYTSKWGKTANLNYFLVPILDANGKPDLIQILVQDFTERKRAEQALRASEQRYRRLFEQNQAGVYYTTLDGQILDCNDTFAHILGYGSAQEMRNHSALDLYFDAADREEFVTALGEKGALINFGSRLRRQDGAPVWVLENVSAVLDETGAPLHIQGTLIDVTERKHAEEQLRASEEKFRAIAEQMVDTLFVTDLDGAITYASPSAARVFGWQPAEIVGRHFSDFLVESELPKAQAQFRLTLETNAPIRHFQVHLQRKGAAPFWGEVSGSALVQNGRVVGAVGLLRDITDILKHQREIEAIATVSAALRAANARSEIVPVVVEHLVALLNAEVSALIVRDPATGEAIVEAAGGALAANLVKRMPGGAGLVSLALNNGESCFSNHPDEFPKSLVASLNADAKPGALAAAPLIAEKKVIAALWLARRQPIAEGDMRILTAVADIAASALQRASLYEQTVVQLERMDALHHIDTAIASSFDLPLTLNILLSEITTRMRVDAAAVLLVNPHTMMLEYAATRGFRAPGLEKQSIRLGNGIAGRVAMERQVIALANFQMRNADNPEALAHLLQADKFVAYLGIPLVVKAQVKGVLELYHRAPFPTDAPWVHYINMLAQQAAIAIGNVQLLEDLQRLNLELGLAYDATIQGWSRALDMRDQETEGHTLRVADLAVRLALKLGLSEAEIIHLRRGALLHDIGKMGVPDSILLKQGPLTTEEWEIMRQHPQYAYDMLAPVTYLLPALDIPYFHHERWDGSGYPRGLKGDKIPLAARIFAVVDVWDAVTSDRPYRAGWSQARAREYLRRHSGKLFDPVVVDAFLAM